MKSDTPETDEATQWHEGIGWAVHAHMAAKLERERNALRDAIKKAAAKYDKIRWGYDGDCGANDIISELEEILLDNAE